MTTDQNKPPDIDSKSPPKSTSIDLQALFAQHSPKNRIAAQTLRSAFNDLLNGASAAQESALSKIIEFGDTAEPLLVTSAGGPDPRVAELSLRGLNEIRSPRYLPCIEAGLSSREVKVRLVALREARQLTDELRNPLFKKARVDPDPRVRQRLLSYLTWSDTSFATQQLTKLCDDPDDTVKWSALEALMIRRPKDACKRIEMLMPDLDPAQKNRATALLEKKSAVKQAQRASESAQAQQPTPSSIEPERAEEAS